MKKYYTVLTLIAVFTLFLSVTALTNSGGAPTGRNGSPASVSTCATAGCHSGGPAISVETISITSDVPAGGYEDSTDYTLTVTANSGSRSLSVFGFQASLEDVNGHIGALSSTNNETRITGDFITHTVNGISGSGGQKSWSFDWNSGTSNDSVVVYVAVNFANGNGSTSGDAIGTATLVLKKQSIGLSENEPLQQVEIYPQPVHKIAHVKLTSTVEKLSLYNLQGQLVQQFDQEHRIGEREWLLDLSTFARGSYVLYSGGEHEVQQLILR